MTAFVLLSDLPHITPADRARKDLHIILDDGDWSPEQVAHYINQWSATSAEITPASEDWTRS